MRPRCCFLNPLMPARSWFWPRCRREGATITMPRNLPLPGPRHGCQFQCHRRSTVERRRQSAYRSHEHAGQFISFLLQGQENLNAGGVQDKSGRPIISPSAWRRMLRRCNWI